MLVINASNTEKDIEWLKSNLVGDVETSDLSDKYALLALHDLRQKVYYKTNRYKIR